MASWGAEENTGWILIRKRIKVIIIIAEHLCTTGKGECVCVSVRKTTVRREIKMAKLSIYISYPDDIVRVTF